MQEGYTQQDGYATTCASPPGEIALGIRMFALEYQAVPVSAAGSGKALVLEFDPGALGKKAFTGTRLRHEGDALSIYRSSTLSNHGGRPFRYVRN